VAFQSGAYVRHGTVGALLSRLDVGVAMFFVLSGFLLARPYVARAAVRASFPATGHYYWKRFVRIYPVYAVTVVIALVAIPENDFGGSLGQWVSSLTLTDVFVRAELPQGLTQMWSLSVEATFYLVLPLLMLALLGRRAAPNGRRTAVVLVLGTLFSCWWNLSLASAIDPVTDGVPLLWLPAHLTWFLVGIGLAAVHVAWQSGSRSRLVSGLVSLGRMPGACWTAATGILVVASTPLGGPTILLAATPTQSLTKHLLYAVFAALIVLTGVFVVPSGHYSRIMSQRFLRHLGHISYSTFCIHLVVLHGIEAMLDYQLFSGDTLLLWVLTLVASLVASEVLYRLVEKPGLRLKEIRRRRREPMESPQTSTTAATTK
jgi:peptidoglycan/LPS O-acetylase OafA/YrhL